MPSSPLLGLEASVIDQLIVVELMRRSDEVALDADDVDTLVRCSLSFCFSLTVCLYPITSKMFKGCIKKKTAHAVSNTNAFEASSAFVA